MKQQFIIQKGHPHLLLFFAGWGMDEHPFAALKPDSCDWMICYDYRSLTFDDSLLRPYTRISLMAWSMGVWAASHIREQYPHLPIVETTAINGTPFPVDDTKGIAPAIFQGTLEGLNEASLQKFQRRMCGSSAAYKQFQAIAPQRTVDELKEELAAIGRQASERLPAPMQWTRALIGQHDRIFLPDNQLSVWEGLAEELTTLDAAHYDAALFESEICAQPHFPAPR